MAKLSRPICRADDCHRQSVRFGYCRNHYEAALLRGEFPGVPIYCETNGCRNAQWSKGLCMRHYRLAWNAKNRKTPPKSDPVLGATLPGEIWRAIPGLGGAYEASSLGRVRSLTRFMETAASRRSEGFRKLLDGRLLDLRVGRGGYLMVGLSIGRRSTSRTVHSVVAAAFHGPRPRGMQVNHRDGDKLNNRPENLEYVTPAENAQHAYDTGLQRRGEGHYNAKLTEAGVREIRALRGKVSRAELAKRYGVTEAAIKTMLGGYTWRHVK